MDKPYNYTEIEQFFAEWLGEQDQEWLEQNMDDIHHHCFNTDYYIIGTQRAIDWMGSKAFDIIEVVKEYEQDNFGEVTTDLSSPEKVVNMYAYIVGEQVVANFMEAQQAA